jgi:hypothetical protein
MGAGSLVVEDIEVMRLFFSGQLVAVGRECFTKSIAGTAAGWILVTRTTRLAC